MRRWQKEDWRGINEPLNERASRVASKDCQEKFIKFLDENTKEGK